MKRKANRTKEKFKSMRQKLKNKQNKRRRSRKGKKRRTRLIAWDGNTSPTWLSCHWTTFFMQKCDINNSAALMLYFFYPMLNNDLLGNSGRYKTFKVNIPFFTRKLDQAALKTIRYLISLKKTFVACATLTPSGSRIWHNCK